ncbi:zinc-binding dehydrogenase [Streptomyces sp. NPDC039016]|uniref:alcohol dehydrogenase catalytic domain-containing protein n=1 Tax=Streptomyces sp. NPDC039016 TaxID=3154330 RepID=UPI0033C7129A
MKAIGLTRFGGPEVLQVVDLPEPEPGRGEVRIRVHAAAVNPTDLTFRTGGRAEQLAQHPAPYVPGMDVAGVVDKLGPDTDARLAVGDRVVASVIPFGPHGGTYAEQLVVAQESVVPAPEKATFPEAATLLLNAVTARLSLDALALLPGRQLVVLGAAGAVGGFAVELAKRDGLTVLAYAAEKDRAVVGKLGADQVVPRCHDAATDLRAVVPGGAPALIDGAALNAQALGAAAGGGALVSLKGWTGPAERGITIHPVSSYVAANDTALLDRLARQAEAGELTLRVGEVLPAARAAEAHRRLAAGGVRGRLVLDLANPRW